MLWAVENGIIGGYENNIFRPDNTCTSGHVVTFLWRAQGKPEANCFSELDNLYSGMYYTDAINWADCAGLLSGIPFNPTVDSPRSEIVLYLYRNAQ